ncbi:snaclec macrovipecetin subunit beta-like [Neolamprologus brichardi]|uniref:snaclec macrovipecetin subunit beta-like n=1 Tax=Neolamprologus brichardi TaxID=32507 RepID=UPI001643BDF8|nr:snaclec macrovipecetin subunit beta-like [Neolamprologus brichardi]
MTDEMKRGQPLQKAGRTAVGKEGFAELPNQYGGNCPPEFHEHRGQCFGFFNIPRAWIDAEKYCCLWFDVNLASIHEWDEYVFVIKLMNEMGYHGPAWIGASDAVRFGDWLWSDGSVTDFNMNPDWNKWGRCLSIGSNDYPTSKRHDCEESLPFICARRPGLC